MLKYCKFIKTTVYSLQNQFVWHYLLFFITSYTTLILRSMSKNSLTNQVHTTPRISWKPPPAARLKQTSISSRRIFPDLRHRVITIIASFNIDTFSLSNFVESIRTPVPPPDLLVGFSTPTHLVDILLDINYE